MVFIGGFIGPCHSPARIKFSAFIRIPGGRLVTASIIGHSDCLDDLKSCTPSEHKIKPVCSGTDRNPPGFESFFVIFSILYVLNLASNCPSCEGVLKLIPFLCKD